MGELALVAIVAVPILLQQLRKGGVEPSVFGRIYLVVLAVLCVYAGAARNSDAASSDAEADALRL